MVFQNEKNILHDTQTDRVLVSSEFAYWGGFGPEIPIEFRDYDGIDICARHGHKSRIFPINFVHAFVEWFHDINECGYLSDPLDWPKTL